MPTLLLVEGWPSLATRQIRPPSTHNLVDAYVSSPSGGEGPTSALRQVTCDGNLLSVLKRRGYTVRFSHEDESQSSGSQPPHSFLHLVSHLSSLSSPPREEETESTQEKVFLIRLLTLSRQANKQRKEGEGGEVVDAGTTLSFLSVARRSAERIVRETGPSTWTAALSSVSSSGKEEEKSFLLLPKEGVPSPPLLTGVNAIVGTMLDSMLGDDSVPTRRVLKMATPSSSLHHAVTVRETKQEGEGRDERGYHCQVRVRLEDGSLFLIEATTKKPALDRVDAGKVLVTDVETGERVAEDQWKEEHEEAMNVFFSAGGAALAYQASFSFGTSRSETASSSVVETTKEAAPHRSSLSAAASSLLKRPLKSLPALVPPSSHETKAETKDDVSLVEETTRAETQEKTPDPSPASDPSLSPSPSSDPATTDVPEPPRSNPDKEQSADTPTDPSTFPQNPPRFHLDKEEENLTSSELEETRLSSHEPDPPPDEWRTGAGSVSAVAAMLVEESRRKEEEGDEETPSSSSSSTTILLSSLSFPMCTLVLPPPGGGGHSVVVVKGGFPPDVLLHLLQNHARSFPGEREGKLVFGSLSHGSVFLGGWKLNLASARIVSGHVLYDVSSDDVSASLVSAEVTSSSTTTGKQKKLGKLPSKSSNLGWIG